MKRKRRHFNPVLLFLCVYIFGLFICAACSGAINWTYAYLNHLLPRVFPIHNKIYAPEAYARLERIKGILAIFLSLLVINLIALRIDNKKYERISLVTEGQYLVWDGIKIYFKEFFKSDLLISTLAPALLIIPAYLLSDDALGHFGLIVWNWLGYNMKSVCSLFPAMLTVAVFSFVGRMIAIPHCVKAWRAAWLTDI